MGFPGFVMSDWYAQHPSGVESALAGLDMSMPGNIVSTDDGYTYWGANLTTMVLNGTVPQWRVDDMATRIMAAFYYVGLDQTHQENYPNDGPNFYSWSLNEYDFKYQGAGEGPVELVNKFVDVRSDYSNHIAHQLAVEPVTLLKNEKNILPLSKDNNKPRKIAILGKAAAPDPVGPNCQKDLACSNGAMASGWGSGAVKYPFLITPYEGISSRAIKEGISVGFNFEDLYEESELFDNVAQYSDINFIFGLTNSGESFLQVDGNLGDRKNMSLWHNADEVILRAASLNKNNVVVISSVGAVNMERWIDHPNITAVLFTLPTGEYFGQAVAEVIFGDYNPSGKLPFTIAKDDNDYSPIVNTVPKDGVPQDNFDDSIYVDYRYFDHLNLQPRFEFGFGLSYSEWTLDNAKIEEIYAPAEHLPPPPDLKPVQMYKQEDLDPKDAVFPKGFYRYQKYLYPYIEDAKQAVPKGEYKYPDGYSDKHLASSSLAGGAPGGNPALWDVVYRVSSEITNHGPYEGANVVQLYLGLPDSDKYPTPPKQLRGFDKVSLQPKSNATVSFDLLRRDLSVWDVETKSWIVLRGTYDVYIGTSSRDIELFSSFTIS